MQRCWPLPPTHQWVAGIPQRTVLARPSEHLLQAGHVAASLAERLRAPPLLVRKVCFVDAVIVGDAPRALQMEFPVALGVPLAKAEAAGCWVEPPIGAVGSSLWKGCGGETGEYAAVDDGEAREAVFGAHAWPPVCVQTVLAPLDGPLRREVLERAHDVPGWGGDGVGDWLVSPLLLLGRGVGATGASARAGAWRARRGPLGPLGAAVLGGGGRKGCAEPKLLHVFLEQEKESTAWANAQAPTSMPKPPKMTEAHAYGSDAHGCRKLWELKTCCAHA
ncbi:hypothetical protein EMVG_00134 [Emiliania huxleyi virus PS401]|nr:hypothetical protein EMVG_00134 [Emiliania huxleyi virus PS401]